MRKKKLGDVEPPSQEEIAKIRNSYTKDTIFYTEPLETANEVSIDLPTE